MLYAVVAVIILILDQSLKYWATVNLALGEGVKELIPKVLHLTLIHNEGAAFGLLSSVGWARWLFIILTVAFVIAVASLISTRVIHGEFGRWMAVLVLAGAVGNLIDRIIHGYVVDMIELEFMKFPVFNVADIFITVGGILFCVSILLGDSSADEEDMEAEAEKAARLAAAKRSKGRVANIDDISRISAGGGVTVRRQEESAPRRRAEDTERRQSAQRPRTEQRRMTVEEQREDYARRQRETYAHGATRAERAAEVGFETDPIDRPRSVEIPVITPTEPEISAKPSVSDDDMNFSLEDILNEFR